MGNSTEKVPQGEKIKVTYKVCFPLKINEEGLHFDDEVKKVENYMTSISFSAIKTDNTRIVAAKHALIAI